MDVHKAVEEAARAARGTVPGLAGVPDRQLDHALRAMAEHLGMHAAEVLEANGPVQLQMSPILMGAALLEAPTLDGAAVSTNPTMDTAVAMAATARTRCPNRLIKSPPDFPWADYERASCTA